ncbi:P-loop containing nucleoside triphosphate hydrolase protein [Fennellomyces sp. T-0311]|nr:P-loop containing nucleoside triphosphate hydrolase protein [Fennellomyces sp. T-0311]
MAPLKVIGGGMDRTGTDSLSVALDMIGYKTHHMRLLYYGQGDPDIFKEAYVHPEKPVDWDAVYAGFDAALGSPTTIFLERLLVKYPDAKIILTLRDPDSWYKSVKNTIFQMTHKPLPPSTPKHLVRIRDMAHTICLDGSFGKPDEFNDAQAMKDKFIKHNEWVKQHVPAGQLLIMELGDGWDKLCTFLNKPIPKEPYPHTNSTQELLEKVAKAREEREKKL